MLVSWLGFKRFFLFFSRRFKKVNSNITLETTNDYIFLEKENCCKITPFFLIALRTYSRCVITDSSAHLIAVSEVSCLKSGNHLEKENRNFAHSLLSTFETSRLWFLRNVDQLVPAICFILVPKYFTRSISQVNSLHARF